MKLFVVRHGQTVANLRNECQGHLPGLLTEQGRCEARIIGNALKNVHFDLCISSDLQRARDTASEIRQCHTTDFPITEDNRLRERFFGPLQGKCFPKVWDEEPFRGQIESLEEMQQRLSSWTEDLIKQHPEQSILVVSHGFTIQLLLALFSQYTLQQIDLIPVIGNCSLSVIEIDRMGKATVSIINQQFSQNETEK